MEHKLKKELWSPKVKPQMEVIGTLPFCLITLKDNLITQLVQLSATVMLDYIYDSR